MNTNIEQSRASGPEVEKIVQAMESAIGDKPPFMVLMACLSLALILQHPDISVEELQRGVKDSSQFIALWLSNLENPALSKEQIN